MGRRVNVVVVAALASALIAACAGGSSEPRDASSTSTSVAEEPTTNGETTTTSSATATTGGEETPDAPTTVGPNGEVATPSSELELTDDETDQLRDGRFTAALVWAAGGPFTEAVTAGVRSVFDELGIEIVAQTDAGFDAATQANDVETVMSLQPDIIISLTIDPVSGADTFSEAVDAGVKLVFLSNAPQGYVHGSDYVGLVTDDLAGMGIAAAEILGEAMGGAGKVGYIFHDVPFYVTNQRDQAFKNWLQAQYPDIEIVDEAGMVDPATAEETAAAMLTRNPEIAGIYAPWSTGPGDGVVAALRSAGRDDVAVVSNDLDTPIVLDMIDGGNIVGLAADEAYELGRALAIEGAYGVIDKDTPAFTIVPAFKVTVDNVRDAYLRSLDTTPPAEVEAALGG